jgi:ankyrin repeat protein
MALRGGADVDTSYSCVYEKEKGVYLPCMIAGLEGTPCMIAGSEGTPLHFTADPRITQLLLDANARVDALDEEDYIPLHMACKTGNIAQVEILLSAGANVELRHDGGLSPLLATRCPEVAELLINAGADVNERNQNGFILLELLEEKKDSELVEVLIRAGSRIGCRRMDPTFNRFAQEIVVDQRLRLTNNAIEEKFRHLRSVVDCSDNEGHIEKSVRIGKVKLENFEAYVVYEDWPKRSDGTPWYRTYGPEDFLLLFQEDGFDKRKLSCKFPVTISKTNVGFVKMLVFVGAIINSSDEYLLDKCSYQSNTRAEYVEYSPLFRVTDSLTAKLLIGANADVNAIGIGGHSVLVHHLLWERFDVVKVLLRAGACMRPEPGRQRKEEQMQKTLTDLELDSLVASLSLSSSKEMTNERLNDLIMGLIMRR